jgi:MYXO-CTERM domain-containing protein
MRFSSVLCMATFVSVSAGAAPVHAHVTFPGVVQSTLGLPTPPPCTICHNNPTGGAKTATKPFARYLIMRGLVDPDEDSLRKALALAQADTQGTGYIALLKQSLDPNGAAGTADVPPPDYGCGSHVAPRSGGTPAGPLLVVAFFLGAARRRGEASKHRGPELRRRRHGGRAFQNSRRGALRRVDAAFATAEWSRVPLE